MPDIQLHLHPGLVAPPPLSLYIHLPWCVKKCPYCDFNSHAIKAPLPSRERGGGEGEIPEADYIAALTRDLEHALPSIWGRKIHTVFFGGGTPSLFSPDGIDQILTTVRTLTLLEPLAEITLEANPGTVEAGRFRGYREAGVTRVSLGIQSFNDDALKQLGRIHGASEARRAAELAAQIFDTFNLDLMIALPGQSQTQLQQDIDTALSFNPPHLSCYHLTLEPNTPFGHTPPANLPDDDTSAAMQDWLNDRLTSAGYDHYETSAYAKPRHRSRHNLNYWQFGDYLGIGAGAHSKLSFHDRIIRQMRVKHPAQYMQSLLSHTPPAGEAWGRDGEFAEHAPRPPSGSGIPAGTRPVREGWFKAKHIADERTLTRKDLPFEFMMNALRLNEGVARELFQQRTGLPLLLCEQALNKAVEKKLLEQIPNTLQPTPLGQRFLNELLTLFL